MAPKVSILMVCFNHLEHTRACLEQLVSVTPRGLYELIVVDNGSSDGTADWLEQWGTALPEGTFTVVRSPENLGFVDGNNRAATLARGEYLVFLNNDTLPASGWLEALVALPDADPTVGVVGAKLLNADGTVQEAGGIIYSDASGCNYGRGGFPDHPEFNYVREVDYCSGACLLVRASLFRDLGGFDRRYAPAYFEDSDLCFGARSKGLRVMYQPEAEVVHFEGVTAGRDTASGYKRFQDLNRPKFAAKWALELTRQPLPMLEYRANARAAHRCTGDQVFLFHDTPPMYDRASGSQRLFHIARLLVARGHHVTFACLHGETFEGLDLAPYATRLRRMGVMVYPLDRPDPKTGKVDHGTAMVRMLAERDYDSAHLPFYESALQMIPRLLEVSPRTRIVIDSMDLDFRRRARQALRDEDPVLWSRLEVMKARELAAYRCADVVFTVTEAERDVLRGLLPGRDVRVAPDTYHVIESEPGFDARRDLMFLAGFRHTPNVDAVHWFHRQVWPLVRQRLPGVRWLIVGDRPPVDVQRLHGGDIVVTGQVPDLAPYLLGARVGLVPLLYGAGMKGKICMAHGHGLPSVSTPVGVEGMDLVDGRDVVVAATPEQFADAIVKLYTDPAAWKRISDAGRKIVKGRHGDQAITRILEDAHHIGPFRPRGPADLSDPLDLAMVMSRAHSALKDHSPAVAARLFTQCLESHPGLPGAVAGLALALEGLKDRPAAARLLQGSLADSPRPAVLLTACGRLLEGAGQLEDAVRQYQTAMDLEPANVWAVTEATRLAESHGNLEVAVAGYSRLCDLLPQTLWPSVKRAELLSRMGDPEALRAALEDFTMRAHAALRTDLVKEVNDTLGAMDGTGPAPLEPAGACAA
jgi:O-antigen biosynthesis protein